MVGWLADLLQRLFRVPEARTERGVRLVGAALAAASFVLITTL